MTPPLSLNEALFPAHTPAALSRMRRHASTLFVVYCWAMAPFVTGVAWFGGGNWAVVGAAGLAASAAATISARTAPDALRTRLTVMTAMLTLWMMLIYAAAPFGNGEFILDAHMLFFVIMGALIGYVCPLTLLSAAAIAFVHHLSFNFLAPTLVWPTAEYALAHLLVHAGVVILILFPTLVFAETIRRLMTESEAALTESETRKLAAENAVEERECATRESAEQRAELMAELSEAFGAVVQAASRGDFSRRIDRRFPDETLNELAARMNELLNAVESGVSETQRVMASLASGDLSARMNGEFHGAFQDLQRDVNRTYERLSELFENIAGAARNIGDGADDIASNADSLAQRTEQQAASLRETSSAMEEMSAAIRSNANNATRARSLTTNASERASSGGEIVGKAVNAMSEIEAGAAKISDIISVIDGIAFQTNLLALNAAVEAARAGDAGKGFAVVASEVRALAQRASGASRDIRGLIESSASQVGEGVRLVTETGEAFEGIVEAIANVEDAIRNIAETSVEQSSSVEGVSSAVASMDQMTRQNASIAESGASTARLLSENAGVLQRVLSDYAGARGGLAMRTEQSADAEWRATAAAL